MSNTQSRNKTLVFIIFLLLLTNILVVGYFLFYCNKPRGKGKDDFNAMLQKEVGFSDAQVSQFNKLKEKDWSQAKSKMDSILEIKNAIYDLTRQSDVPDSVIENMADSIGHLQKQVEMSAYRHVLATRSICTPQQLAAYDTLMKRLINKGRRNGRPPYDGPPPSKRN